MTTAIDSIVTDYLGCIQEVRFGMEACLVISLASTCAKTINIHARNGGYIITLLDDATQ